MKWPLALALAALAGPADAETRSGPATVVDGDTLEVGGRRIRLFGIDAPELTQECDANGRAWACGQAAAEQLRAMTGNHPIECNGHEVDARGRLLAVCTASGIDLGRHMVAEGWALVYRRYSEAYVREETRARANRLGIWSGSFTPPEAYRAAQEGVPAEAGQPRGARSAQAAPPARASPACLIKGNRNRRGEWIYHLPGMPYYEATRAEEMFCTEAQAQAAGYRRSRAQ